MRHSLHRPAFGFMVVELGLVDGRNPWFLSIFYDTRRGGIPLSLFAAGSTALLFPLRVSKLLPNSLIMTC